MRQIVDDDRRGRVDRADFRRDDQVDDAVGKHGRREGQADAERLPFDRDARCCRRPAAAAVLGDRDREFAAGEEARGLARQRDQGRLGERRDRALALERVERDVEVRAERAERAAR